MKKIDLLLINPGNRLEQFAELNELATIAQPLGIAMIASFVKDMEFTVDIIDAEAENLTPEEVVVKVGDYQPLLVGLTAFTTKMTSAGKILRLIKQTYPEMFTIIGGHHASAIPEKTLYDEAVDFVCQGEGYYPVVELLAQLKAGKFIGVKGIWHKNSKGNMAQVNHVNLLPSPAWDLLPMEKYRAHHWQTWEHGLDSRGFAVLYTTLGCPYSCEFCSVNVVYGEHRQRVRRIDSVIKDLDELVNKYHVKYIEIIDDTFTLNEKRTRELCKEIAHSGIEIHAWAFARTSLTKEVAHWMRKAGIEWVVMGFESGNNGVLKTANKRQTVDKIKRAVDIAHSEGLHVGGNYIFGLLNDTLDTMRDTFNLAKDLNTEYANFFVNMAYPGTKLYDYALVKGYALPRKWSQYGFFAPDALPLRSEALTASEILRFRDNAFNEYFTSDKYLNMIDKKFGSDIVRFIQEKITSRKIERVNI